MLEIIAKYGDVLAAGVVAIIGVIAGSQLARKWGTKQGRKLGRYVAKVTPGAEIDAWLAEFLKGVQEGLNETPGPEQAEIKVEKKTHPLAGTEFSFEIKREF